MVVAVNAPELCLVCRCIYVKIMHVGWRSIPSEESHVF